MRCRIASRAAAIHRAVCLIEHRPRLMQPCSPILCFRSVACQWARPRQPGTPMLPGLYWKTSPQKRPRSYQWERDTWKTRSTMPQEDGYDSPEQQDENAGQDNEAVARDAFLVT